MFEIYDICNFVTQMSCNKVLLCFQCMLKLNTNYLQIKYVYLDFFQHCLNNLSFLHIFTFYAQNKPKHSLYQFMFVRLYVGNARERIFVRISREDGRTDYGETFVSDLYMREKIGYLELAYAFFK